MSSTNDNDDALKTFNELYGDLEDSNMGASETPQSNEKAFDEKDPYSYNPFDRTQLPQTEGEVKNVIEDLTHKLRVAGLTRRNLLNRPLGDQRQCTQANYRSPKC